jgi:hypothetical protein
VARFQRHWDEKRLILKGSEGSPLIARRRSDSLRDFSGNGSGAAVGVATGVRSAVSIDGEPGSVSVASSQFVHINRRRDRA